MKDKSLIIILSIVAILLLIPFIAMQFTIQVNWSPIDFVVMGLLLLTVGLVIELVLRKVRKKEHRILLIITSFLVFLLVWAELAVGIFGTPFAGS